MGCFVWLCVVCEGGLLICLCDVRMMYCVLSYGLCLCCWGICACGVECVHALSL